MARFGEIGKQYFDDAGDPLISGKLYFYESGTLTPKDTFADSAESIANPNPVALTASGRQPNIFFTGTAKVVLTSGDSVQIEVRDPEGVSVGSNFEGWDTLSVYPLNRIVTLPNGGIFRSSTTNNQGNTPSATSAYWEEVEFLGVWNPNVTYKAFQVVRASDGRLHSSISGGNLNNNPVSNPTKWFSSGGASLRQIADASLGTGTHTFDATYGNRQQLTATGNISVAFSNFPVGEVSAFLVDAVNWGAWTITLPAGIQAENSTALGFTAVGTDQIIFSKDKDEVWTMAFHAKNVGAV